MDMPTPTEAHHKLKALVGSWRGEEVMYPSPWIPAGGTGTGNVYNRLALDGFVVVQDYEQERDGKVNFRGHGVFSWDATQNTYLLHWFDSIGGAAAIFSGPFEGNTLELTAKGPEGSFRAVFVMTDHTHYHYRMEVSGDGKQWQKVMSGEYARIDRN